MRNAEEVLAWMLVIEDALVDSDLGVVRVDLPSQRYVLRVTTRTQRIEVPMIDAIVTASDFPANVVRLVRAKLSGTSDAVPLTGERTP